MAEMSQLNAALVSKISQDIDAGALEGLSEEKKVMIRKRAALYAQRFASSRGRAGKLTVTIAASIRNRLPLRP
jgi:hypothetical protein